MNYNHEAEITRLRFAVKGTLDARVPDEYVGLRLEVEVNDSRHVLLFPASNVAQAMVPPSLSHPIQVLGVFPKLTCTKYSEEVKVNGLHEVHRAAIKEAIESVRRFLSRIGSKFIVFCLGTACK